MKYKKFDYFYDGNEVLRNVIVEAVKKLSDVKIEVTPDSEIGDKTGSPDFFYISVYSNYDNFQKIHNSLKENKIERFSFYHYEDEYMECLTEKLLKYFSVKLPDYSFKNDDNYQELIVTHNKELTTQSIALDFEYATDTFGNEILNPKENKNPEFKTYIDNILNQIKTTHGL